MKKVLLFILLLMSCQTKKEIVNPEGPMQKKEVYSCPDDGKCSVEILENKSVNLIKDEFGIPYVNFSFSNSKLIKYSYIKNVEEHLSDGYYEEIIYFEIKDFEKDYNLKDDELFEVNAVYGRICYCKGETGYYTIKEGELSLTKNNNNYNINFTFKINEVPQIINKINVSLNL